MRAPILGLAVLLALASRPAAADDALRVRVAAGVPAVQISGSSLRVDGRAWRSDELRVSAAGGRLRINGKPADQTLVIDARGPIRVDGRAMPGALRLSLRGERSLDAVVLVPLEPYVASAVASETPAGWPAEALKAQAVVARCYALHERAKRAGEPFDLESSVISQRFGVRAGARHARWRRRAPPPASTCRSRASRSSRRSTRRRAARPPRRPRSGARRFRTCAASRRPTTPRPTTSGATRSPSPTSPLRCARRATRRARARRRARDRAQPERPGRARSSSGPRCSPGRDLREVLGGRALRSAMFEVRVEDGRVRFLGSGSGHGVGLCQWGASELAKRGASYRRDPGTLLPRHGPAAPARVGRPHDWSARR